MICVDASRLLDAYVDGELEPAGEAEIRRHLAACDACRHLVADRESLGRLVRQLPYYVAPEALRSRIARATVRPRFNVNLFAVAAVVALAVSVGGSVAIRQFARSRAIRETDSVAEAVVGGHVQALRNARLFDVQSSDQHTVKPWFLGKLDFSPPVEDLASVGFPLVGGRLDHVRGQAVATLVYQRRLHPISVYVWPATDGVASDEARTLRGFQVRHWTRNGMSFWAVSDVNDAELNAFVRELRR